MAKIYKRVTDTGIRYDVRWRVGGRQCRKSFRRKDDANKYLNKVQGEQYAGLVIDPRGAEQQFGPYAKDWLKHRQVKGEPLAPSTRYGYQKLMKRHFTDRGLDTMKLRTFTPQQVRTWHNKVVAESGSDQGAKAYRLLRAILSTAVADQLIALNPCLIKGAGMENTGERPLIELTTLLSLADAITGRLRVAVLMAGFLGFRPGELWGLQRQDIDPLHGTIKICRQRQEIPGMGQVVGDPKSEAGKRERAVDPMIFEEIESHLAAFVAPEPDAYLFTSKHGRPLRRADVSKMWRAACEKVGITPWSAKKHPEGLRLHDLRHVGGTLYAQRPDATLKDVMVAMGHSTPRAALIYQHSAAERDRQAAEFLDAQFAAAKAKAAADATTVRAVP